MRPSTLPVSSPSPTSSPTMEEIFDLIPPSPGECASIAEGTGGATYGGDVSNLVSFHFVAEIDAYTQSSVLDSNEVSIFIENVIEILQREVAPLLAGCDEENKRLRRDLNSDSEAVVNYSKIVDVKIQDVQFRDDVCEDAGSIENTCTPLFTIFTSFVDGNKRLKAFELANPFQEGLENITPHADGIIVGMEFVNIYPNSPTPSPTFSPSASPTDSDCTATPSSQSFSNVELSNFPSVGCTE